jgi:hypothetical protein
MKCPRCANFLAQDSVVSGAGAPQPGDLTVCVHCGVCMVFDESLRRRIASLEDLAKVDRAGLLLIGRLQAAIHIEQKRRLALRN